MFARSLMRRAGGGMATYERTAPGKKGAGRPIFAALHPNFMGGAVVGFVSVAMVTTALCAPKFLGEQRDPTLDLHPHPGTGLMNKSSKLSLQGKPVSPEHDYQMPDYELDSVTKKTDKQLRANVGTYY
jgi:hypothetical protein